MSTGSWNLQNLDRNHHFVGFYLADFPPLAWRDNTANSRSGYDPRVRQWDTHLTRCRTQLQGWIIGNKVFWRLKLIHFKYQLPSVSQLYFDIESLLSFDVDLFLILLKTDNTGYENRMFDLQNMHPCLSSILSHLTPMRRPVVGFKCSHHANFPRPRAWPAQAARQSQYPPPREHREVFIFCCHPSRCQKPQHFNYCCGHGLRATKMNEFEAAAGGVLGNYHIQKQLESEMPRWQLMRAAALPVTRLVFTVFRVSRK